MNWQLIYIDPFAGAEMKVPHPREMHYTDMHTGIELNNNSANCLATNPDVTDRDISND